MSKKSATKNVAKSAVKSEPVVEKKNGKTVAAEIEGLTQATIESKVITFKEGSGSADLLTLIVRHGFDREKVVANALKLKDAGKAFLKSDPAKKYNKVAGIIKNLQNQKYLMPKTA